MKLVDLVNEYNIMQENLDRIYNEIDELLDCEVYYKGIQCMVSNIDIQDESLVLCSIDGSSLNIFGKYETISMSKFQSLIL